jgi:hypothetical protein
MNLTLKMNWSMEMLMRIFVITYILRFQRIGPIDTNEYCEFLISHDGDYRAGCDIAKYGRWVQKTRRNQLPPSSGKFGGRQNGETAEQFPE